MQRLTYILGVVLGTCSILSVQAADLPIPPRALRAAAPKQCASFPIDTKASVPIGAVSAPADGTCKPVIRNGLPLPDPACSPGAVNPTVTLEILTAKGFTTDCLRDKATSSNKERTDLPAVQNQEAGDQYWQQHGLRARSYRVARAGRCRNAG